jgi:C4-dicarboxylate transporter, DctQ subunit
MDLTEVAVLQALDRNVERWALLVFYVLLMVTMAVEVFRREVFSYSSIWGEELVRYSFIYLVWIGAAAAVKERAHIRIDVVFHALSNRGKSLLYIFGDLVMLAISIAVVIWAWHSVEISMRFGSVSHGLRISMVWFLLAVPLGFALMIARLLQSLYRDVRSLISGAPVYEGAKLFD